MTTIHKGDNTQAFGNNFLTIFLDNPMSVGISKVIFSVGCIEKVFENPQFPLRVNFNSKETAALNYINTGYLVAFDSKGRQLACEGSITFYVINGVITQNGKC